jgi:hypothetical protein
MPRCHGAYAGKVAEVVSHGCASSISMACIFLLPFGTLLREAVKQAPERCPPSEPRRLIRPLPVVYDAFQSYCSGDPCEADQNYFALIIGGPFDVMPLYGQLHLSEEVEEVFVGRGRSLLIL